MGLLQGKTALITGAARGIGKSIALKFAAEGANIAFTDLQVNEETEKEIAALGVKAKSYASNAADFAQTEEVVNAVKAEFGSIDILVNNAGITKDGLMLRMTEQQWDAVGEQCRYHQGRSDAAHDRAAVGCCDCSKPEVSLQLHPCLCARYDAPAWW